MDFPINKPSRLGIVIILRRQPSENVNISAHHSSDNSFSKLSRNANKLILRKVLRWGSYSSDLKSKINSNQEVLNNHSLRMVMSFSFPIYLSKCTRYPSFTIDKAVQANQSQPYSSQKAHLLSWYTKNWCVKGHLQGQMSRLLKSKGTKLRQFVLKKIKALSGTHKCDAFVATFWIYIVRSWSSLSILSFSKMKWRLSKTGLEQLILRSPL